MQTQIDKSNALSAAQVVHQLAIAVIKLAGNLLESESDSADKIPLADLSSLEPFAGLFKNMKRNKMPKFDAANVAFAMLKSVNQCFLSSALRTQHSKINYLTLESFASSDAYE